MLDEDLIVEKGVYVYSVGDLDCTQPLCGSLYDTDRPQRKQGEDCACDPG